MSLLGVNSVEVPRPWRFRISERLAGDWRPADIERLFVRTVIGLPEVAAACKELIAGRARGRHVVTIAGGA